MARHPKSPRARRSSILTALTAATVSVMLSLTACGSSGEAAQNADGKTVLRYQGWSGEVYPHELAEDLGYFQKVKLEWVGDTTSGPQDIQSAATGDIEFGSAFNGAVVKLNAAGAPITSVLSSYGADEGEYTGYYVLENSPIRSARDLIGKKVGHEHARRTPRVHRAGVAGPARAVARRDQAVALTVVPPVNTEPALRAGQIDVASLNEHHPRERARSAGASGRCSPTGGCSARSATAPMWCATNSSRRTGSDADFVQGTARAIRWTQVTPREEVVARFREHHRQAWPQRETTETIEYWRSPGIPVAGRRDRRRSELQTWIDWLVRNGELEEGKLNATDLYTNEFNPYANGTLQPEGSGPDGEVLENEMS